MQINESNGPAAGLEMLLKYLKLYPLNNQYQQVIPNCNINADQATVWLHVYYMHLCCAYVLSWSVCARCAQNLASVASYTRAGHKCCNPYIPPHQNGLGEVQPSHSHNKGPTLPMVAIVTMAEYRYIRKPKGKNW